MAYIAQAAAVSPATVDRVLNRRKGVRPRTVERVLRAAVDLGYLSERDSRRIANPRPPNIAFLLPMGSNPYLRLLGAKLRAMAQAKSRDSARIRCYFIDSFDAGALAAAIQRHARWADGIAFLAIDHPLVREAVEAVTAAGRQAVTIVSGLSHQGRAAYVGLDNPAAGRTAGYLLGRFSHRAAGSVGLVVGGRLYRAHAEREMGFLALIEELFPRLTVVGMREGHDNSDANYRHALTLIDQHPNLIGIYNVGGSSDGIARALRDKGRAKDVVFIGHGLTPDTRRLLIEGAMDAVIDADPDVVLATALEILRSPEGSKLPARPAVKMDVFLRENLPVEDREPGASRRSPACFG